MVTKAAGTPIGANVHMEVEPSADDQCDNSSNASSISPNSIIGIYLLLSYKISSIQLKRLIARFDKLTYFYITLGNSKRKGCRCGNATAMPGKLTCCGQRCPCYVDAKACFECKVSNHKLKPYSY